MSAELFQIGSQSLDEVSLSIAGVAGNDDLETVACQFEHVLVESKVDIHPVEFFGAEPVCVAVAAAVQAFHELAW
ncbi:hypothetical protein KRM28CT15_04560 [Krasilnikovia sp. M28-CT-15]